MPQVRVLFFAITRERTGCDVCEIEVVEPATLADVRDAVLNQYPNLKEIEPYIRWAVNQVFESDYSRGVEDQDEIAMIPPVSGGNQTYFSKQPLDVSSLVESVSTEEHGAILTFVGTVRNHTKDHRVSFLEYTAYERMANQAIDAILQSAANTWPDALISIRHRLGRVDIGGVSVVIAVGSPHRVDAFEACRFVIEELKKDVPIFKKEYRENGAAWIGMGS